MTYKGSQSVDWDIYYSPTLCPALWNIKEVWVLGSKGAFCPLGKNLGQCFYKCGPQTSSSILFWKLQIHSDHPVITRRIRDPGGWSQPSLLQTLADDSVAPLVAQTVKKSACNVGDPSLIPGLGRSPGEGNGNTLQYSCLKSFMDRGTWWATVPGIAKCQTWLKD